MSIHISQMSGKICFQLFLIMSVMYIYGQYPLYYIYYLFLPIYMNKKIIPIIGILLVLGVGGFLFLKQKQAPTVSPEIKKVQVEMMANCKYDADFCRYATSGLVAMTNGYTMTSVSTYNGKVSKSVMKSDGKGNLETVSYSDGKEEGNFITLDKSSYMKSVGETVWTEFPPTKDETGKPTKSLFDFEALKKELGNGKDASGMEALTVKKVGTEPCGTFTCTVFEMTNKATPDFKTKIWVDTNQYYARKMESKSSIGVSTMAFEYGPVMITKPSPVKKMPAFNPVIPGGTKINVEELKSLMKNIPQTNVEATPMAEETPTE